MIHCIGNSSEECKVLGEYGAKYAASQRTKDHGRNPLPRKRFQKNQENHAIINNVVDDILLNEPKKVSAVNHEAPDFLENDYDENDLYQVENVSHDENK